MIGSLIGLYGALTGQTEVSGLGRASDIALALIRVSETILVVPVLGRIQPIEENEPTQ
jgi:hypothetical protein